LKSVLDQANLFQSGYFKELSFPAQKLLLLWSKGMGLQIGLVVTTGEPQRHSGLPRRAQG